MKQIFINISILLSFVIYSNLFSQTAPKLEVTINETDVVKKFICSDTVYYCGGYEIGEKYFILQNRYRNKYDTIIIYFDESMKDTMIYSEYHGYKKHSYKQWDKKGKLIAIHDTKLGINKGWYPNGNLRWNFVVNANIDSDDYSNNVNNKTWYANGNLLSEYVRDKDTIINIHYYKNKSIRLKEYYLYHGREIESGDGYRYPKESYPTAYFRIENYCKNGQLERQHNFGYTEKDKKSYFCNGNTKSYIEKYYKQMRLVGKYLYYYETGQLRIKGQYKEYDNGPQNVSVEIGEFIYYDINGNVEKTEFYDDNGNLVTDKK
jgi:antitoxin component YwqK of YwqJK toxin-antitoxin module